jgi:hypothetical protein
VVLILRNEIMVCRVNNKRLNSRIRTSPRKLNILHRPKDSRSENQFIKFYVSVQDVQVSMSRSFR